MIVLFGSHARGDWIEDRYTGDDGIVYEYKSDFDILAVNSSANTALNLNVRNQRHEHVRNK